MKQKLTLVAVFYNEEEKLPGYFKNVKGIFDDIVVVDCSSTDRTAQICRDNGARMFTSKLRFFENNIGFALDQVRDGSWAFILSADERLSKELKKEIRLAIAHKDIDYYQVRRMQYFFDGFTKVGRINDLDCRLFRKGAVRWGRGMPHEKPSAAGRVARLKSAYYHYAYPTVHLFLKKTEEYIYKVPEEFAKSGKKKVASAERDPRVAALFGTHGLRMLFIYPTFTVLVMLLRYGLLFNGMRGIIYAICVGAYAFFEEASFWETSSKKSRGIKFDWRKEYPDEYR